MTDQGHKVLAGFVRLMETDRGEVTTAINRFLAASPREQADLRREFERAIMGPVHSSCPCCDREREAP